MFVDTHTHLYTSEFQEDNSCKDAVERALAANVRRLIMPNIDVDSLAPMHSLASQFPSNISMAIGLHPTEVKNDWQDVLAQILQYSPATDYCAIGEIGIDLYWDKTYADAQMQALDRQVSIAEERDLPIIIHCREGLDQTIEVLQGHKRAKGVFHSFGGSDRDVEKIRNAVGDWYFGINGIVTFKKSTLPQVLPAIGLNRILLETDSPYLAPVPRRGKRNESSYIPYIAQCIADNMGYDIEMVAETTTTNAVNLFKLR